MTEDRRAVRPEAAHGAQPWRGGRDGRRRAGADPGGWARTQTHSSAVSN